MKRSEINVGDVLFWGASQSWWNYDHDTGKATVVALWAVGARWRKEYTEVEPGTRGAGILVDIEQPAPWSRPGNEEIRTTRRVVPPGQLRGPYEETKARRDEHLAGAKEEASRTQRERERAQAHANVLLTRIQDLVGGATEFVVGYDGYTQMIEMAPWVLEKLLELLDKRPVEGPDDTGVGLPIE